MLAFGRSLLSLTALAAFWCSTVARCPAQPWERRDLLSFGQRDLQGGEQPADPPILGADGALYGTTEFGGAFSQGVIYRFDPADRSYVVLHHFTGPQSFAQTMGSTLCQAGDGRLYGLAVHPGLFLYSLKTDGTDFRALFDFPAGAEEGGGFGLVNWLRPGPDGRLYGLYQTGSINGAHVGHFFRIDLTGGNFQPLGTALDVTSPLSFGADGRLYGTTSGSVFRMEADGTGFTTLRQLPTTQFGAPLAEGGVLHHSNGFLYGFTARGGSNGFGMFYRLRPDGSQFEVVFQPTINVEAGHLRAPMFEGNDGFIYGSVGEDGFGTTSFVWRIRPDGTGWQVLKRLNFNGRGSNGVVLAPDGFLYSFTTSHPDDNCLFRVGRDGSGYEIVWRFATDDAFPLTPVALVRGSDQRFYGLTSADGTGGRGTLFRVGSDGTGYTVVHDFGSGPAAEQGNLPKAICASPDGNLYGVVRQLGSTGAGIFRFEIASGQFSWIQNLPSGQTADYAAIVVSNADGLLYAGVDSSPFKTERLIRLHPSGTGFTVLRTFNSSSASFAGSGALVEGPDGLLYGITMRNGTGTLPLLFRIGRDGSGFQSLTEINAGTFSAATPRGLLVTPAGQVFGHASTSFWRCQTNGTGFTVLRNFDQTGYGENPLLGFDGKVYSYQRFTALGGGGAVFRINPDGSGYEDIALFPASEPLSGKYPVGSLLTGPDGAFYVLNSGGGFANHGTLTRLATPAQLVGLAPGTFGFDARGRFAGAVVGPPGRPVDVWRSDDLLSWSLLQRVTAPETDPSFKDAGVLPGRRFYRATAP